MHDGRFKTLEDVLEHYSHNIQDNPKLSFQLKKGTEIVRMEFTPEEKSALVAFLNTMTDKSLISEKKYSSPFIK